MTASDEHIAWLERELAKAERRLDATYAEALEALDLAAGGDYDGWDEAQERALGKPEDRLRHTWGQLDQTPPGREASTTAEMRAAVSAAQQAEIARLRSEVALAQASDEELVAEWFSRAGVRR